MREVPLYVLLVSYVSCKFAFDVLKPCICTCPFSHADRCDVPVSACASYDTLIGLFLKYVAVSNSLGLLKVANAIAGSKTADRVARIFMRVFIRRVAG